ncbi:MAG: FliG C-terminal domain-containing protein [Oligoflexales bacterium]
MRLRRYNSIAIWLFLIAISSSRLFGAGTKQEDQQIRQESIAEITKTVTPLLRKYCSDACQLIRVDVAIDHALQESNELGFEGEQSPESLAYVEKVTVSIQVDSRVTNSNRERLGKILNHHIESTGLPAEVSWVQIELPQIGESAELAQKLINKLRARISRSVENVIQSYCPEQCLLSNVDVDGHLISPDEASGLNPREVIRSSSGRGFLKIDRSNVLITMDRTLGGAGRERILNLIQARTRFVSNLEVDTNITDFPESHTARQERINSEADDPYGLEKLRRVLTLFRDLAGTREIISSASHESETESWMAWLGLLSAIALIGGITYQLNNAKRDAAALLAEPQTGKSETENSEVGDEIRKELNLRIRNQEVRKELIDLFTEAPRVAKETFSRLLQEDGVEETAKYVHIFGKMVIMDLLNDPNLQRDLYELTEYYHKSDFVFTLEEEWKLLSSLKTRVTASEIRVLAKNTMDQFEFLNRLDASQIYNLVADEKPQVQGIVLTQVDHKQRRTVFDMFKGDEKVALMKELCRADAIPKEYLQNVAKALGRKVLSKPEFDTQNLRSSDVLLDLLEKASLKEQRALMTNLTETNPDAARAIKLKLVTIEMLPFLKDGHLLEVIMGLEREDLLTFLKGADEHILELLLSHVPQELADSWLEDLESIASVDDSKYRLVEMMVLGRVRNLASNGAFNLLDINEMLFAEANDNSNQGPSQQGPDDMNLGLSPMNLIA